MNPARLSEIEASESRAAAARTSLIATTPNAATPVIATAVTEAVGGAPSRVQSQSAAAATSAAPAPATSAVVSSSVAPSSSAVVSSASSSSVRPSSSSTSIRPTTSSTSSTATSTSSRSVLTVTSNRATSSSSTSSSAAATASAAAASQSSDSEGLSIGAIAGLAVGVLFGLVILGSAIGWLYRKHSQRKYSTKAPWSKIDDDVTPFPPSTSEKQHYLPPDEDIYGQSQAPVIGSRRALALARDNAFHHDGSMRPDSNYMMPRDNNMAGYGAGNGLGAQYGAYPAMHSPAMHSPGGYDYGRPAQGYGHDGGRATSPVTQDYDYEQQPGMAVTAPGNTRQLVGPGGPAQSAQSYGMPMPAPVLAPMAMGRPAPPRSDSEFADREEFMDLPKPTPAATSNSSAAHMSQYSTYGLAYADSEPDYMPHTATTTGWAGDAKVPQSAAPTALPAIEPASPLMSGFDFQKRQSQPLGPIAATFASKYGQPGASSTLPMYEDEDESSRQKRMYGEVAHAAGVMEPTTPHTATTPHSADLSHSTNSYQTASSFSAHDPAGRSLTNSTDSHRLPHVPSLPTVNLTPPQPYQHGQPLSPLPEVQTPASTTIPLTSSSLMHGQEINPFEQHVSPDQSLLTPRAQRPPHSAVSSTGATSFPSPSYPPPSPGGMSVPGSVSDSPGNRRQSMFDGDDAYGGI